MKILVVAATQAEADSLKAIPGIEQTHKGLSFRNNEIVTLVTGVGSVATAWAMTKWISYGSKPDLAVNIGIAGSFTDDLRTGEAVVPVSDCFADAGIDTGKGFLTLAEAGLEDPDKFPFRGGRIIAENNLITRAITFLRPVTAITVNTASGSLGHIKMILKRFHPDIETMEGAAFFYICSKENIPFLALRAISNKVEPQNKKRWNIPLALENLSKQLREVLLLLE